MSSQSNNEEKNLINGADEDFIEYIIDESDNTGGTTQPETGSGSGDLLEMVELEEAGDASDSELEKQMYGIGGDHHHRHHHHEYKHRRKKKHAVRNVILIILGILLVLILAAFIIFMVMSARGKKELLNYTEVSVETPENLDVEVDNEGIVTYNGKKYRFNTNVASIVLLGIDRSDLGTDIYGDAGQADAVYILTYDTSTKNMKIISVSRDTMTDVNVYSTSGSYIGTENLQICLSYAYGDGREASCENTLTALSRIFYNIPFNSYVALDWDSVAVVNDAVGGVELTALESFGSFTQGETFTLMGQNAFDYIHYRDTSYLESNTARLERQKQYITAFANKVISETKKNLSIPLNLYGILSDYMVTNVSANQVSYIASQAITSVNSMSDVEFLSIDGEITKGEEYAEFYPDEQTLYELILYVFYEEVE